FRALNDTGEGLLQKATERLSAMGSKVLKRNIVGSREEILETRRESVQVARDMAYKRTAMLELARERPVLLSVEEFDRFNRQIHRYAALVEDAEGYAEHCKFNARRAAGPGRGGNQPKPLHTDDVLGDIPAGNADREHLGYECRRHPVQWEPERILGGRRVDNRDLRVGRDCHFPI